MSRHDETMGVAPNPSQYYLEWNSEQSAFCYWDKESETRQPMKLPFRFLALKFANSVAGFDDSRQQGIYSNEVIDTRTEPLHVQYRRKDPADYAETIAQGLYGHIKNTVKASGGHFARSIYAMSPKGVIINIRIKGSQIIQFGAIEKYGKRWQDEWIVVGSAETREFDSKPYTVPVFTFGGTVNVIDNDRAKEAYAIVKNYFDSKHPVATPATHQPSPQPEPQPAWANIADDDLPF